MDYCYPDALPEAEALRIRTAEQRRNLQQHEATLDRVPANGAHVRQEQEDDPEEPDHEPPPLQAAQPRLAILGCSAFRGISYVCWSP